MGEDGRGGRERGERARRRWLRVMGEGEGRAGRGKVVRGEGSGGMRIERQLRSNFRSSQSSQVHSFNTMPTVWKQNNYEKHYKWQAVQAEAHGEPMVLELRADKHIHESLVVKVNTTADMACKLAKVEKNNEAATASLMHIEFMHIETMLSKDPTDVAVEQCLAKLVLYCERETNPEITKSATTPLWVELRHHTSDCFITATARGLRHHDLFGMGISPRHHARMTAAFGFNPRPLYLRLWSNLGLSKRKVFGTTIKDKKSRRRGTRMSTATRRKPMDNDLGNAEDEVLEANGDAGEAGCEVLKMDDMELNELGKEGELGELGEVDKAECKLVETTSEFCKAEGQGEVDVACGEMIQTMSKMRGKMMPKETLQTSMENDPANADGEELEAKCDAGKACGEMLETQSEMDVAGGEVLETKAKLMRMSAEKGREKRQRLKESTTEMHEAIDEAEEIRKRVEKVMKNA